MEANHYLAFVLETNGHDCCAITQVSMWIVVLRNLKTKFELVTGTGLLREIWKWILKLNVCTAQFVEKSYKHNTCSNSTFKTIFKTIVQIHVQIHFRKPLSIPLFKSIYKFVQSLLWSYRCDKWLPSIIIFQQLRIEANHYLALEPNKNGG